MNEDEKKIVEAVEERFLQAVREAALNAASSAVDAAKGFPLKTPVEIEVTIGLEGGVAGEFTVRVSLSDEELGDRAADIDATAE